MAFQRFTVFSTNHHKDGDGQFNSSILYANSISLHFVIPFGSSILARSSTVGQWSAGSRTTATHAEFTQWNHMTILADRNHSG